MIKIPRYVIEYANSVLRSIESHTDINCTNWWRDIDRAVSNCQSGMITVTEAMSIINYFDRLLRSMEADA